MFTSPVFFMLQAGAAGSVGWRDGVRRSSCCRGLVEEFQPGHKYPA